MKNKYDIRTRSKHNLQCKQYRLHVWIVETDSHFVVAVIQVLQIDGARKRQFQA